MAGKLTACAAPTNRPLFGQSRMVSAVMVRTIGLHPSPIHVRSLLCVKNLKYWVTTRASANGGVRLLLCLVAGFSTYPYYPMMGARFTVVPNWRCWWFLSLCRLADPRGDAARRNRTTMMNGNKGRGSTRNSGMCMRSTVDGCSCSHTHACWLSSFCLHRIDIDSLI